VSKKKKASARGKASKPAKSSVEAKSAAKSSEPADDPESRRFPAGVPFIVGNEGAERFSFYGMRAILKTYLTTLYISIMGTQLAGEALEKAASSKATAVTHLFIAGVYAFPMIGALMADRLLGKYPVIFWLSLVYCAGHGMLAIAGRFGEWEIWGFAEYGFYIGLALIAIGSGGIKPCVSANVGDQFTEKNRGLVTMVFQIFYFIINFGSFFSTVLTPILKNEFGPEVAFGVPGIFMGLATVVFWLGRKRFVRVPPNPGGTLGFLDVIASTLFFMPIIALIVAVFIVADGYETPEKTATMGALDFYWAYLSTYVPYLLKHSWYFFVIGLTLAAGGFGLFVFRQTLKQDTGFLAMIVYAFKHRAKRKPGTGFFSVVKDKYGEEVAEGPPAVLRIILVFSMVSVFWALFDQHASTWITQAQRMNLELTVPVVSWNFLIYGTIALALYGGIWLFMWISNQRLPRIATFVALGVIGGVGVICGIVDVIIWWSGGPAAVWREQTLAAEQLSALNPLMVMIIIPLLNVAVYRPLEKVGVTVRPLQKMTVGMFFAAAAFAVAAFLQGAIEGAGNGNVHVLWQTLQYIVMTTSEVLVSITGLEFAYTQAPRSMKSTIMGFWLLSVTFGNVLVAFLAPMEKILELSEFFWVFTGLMALAAVIFAVLAYFYKGKTYLHAAR
jgi:POT family proton-dependent oligopeptide transporter